MSNYTIFMENKYYDGTKLLSLKDINGNTPEIFIACGNRSAGKTTYFSRMLIKRFLNKGKKFVILYRFSKELKDVSEKFFSDINTLFFPNFSMFDLPRANGAFRELFIKDNTKSDDKGNACGYAVALNSADEIKKYSHFFKDVCAVYFDEFQSETNHYCTDEVNKFISIHVSMARGGGSVVRYLPVYMCSNTVSLLNPYFAAFGIHKRINKETKYLRGDGLVFEQTYNEAAADAQKSSGFIRAFNNNNYVRYSTENIYLNDNLSFVEKMTGLNKYLVTIRYNSKEYAIRQYIDAGLIYCDDRVDNTFKSKICVTTEDHNINYVMLKQNDIYIIMLRKYFARGCFRFKNLECKDAVLSLLAFY